MSDIDAELTGAIAYMRQTGKNTTVLGMALDEIRRQREVIKDYGDQIIESRRQRQAEEAAAGQPLAYVVPLPKGYEHDHWVFATEEDAQGRANEIRESEELDAAPPVIPLFALGAISAQQR